MSMATEEEEEESAEIGTIRRMDDEETENEEESDKEEESTAVEEETKKEEAKIQSNSQHSLQRYEEKMFQKNGINYQEKIQTLIGSQKSKLVQNSTGRGVKEEDISTYLENNSISDIELQNFL